MLAVDSPSVKTRPSLPDYDSARVGSLTHTRFVKPNRPAVIAKGAHPHLSLRGAQRRGNLVAVAMVVCRRVFNLNEIATLRSQ